MTRGLYGVVLSKGAAAQIPYIGWHAGELREFTSQDAATEAVRTLTQRFEESLTLETVNRGGRIDARLTVQ